jgi:hypothetical protein
MSNIQARTYEGAVAVTASDSTDDPGGPFAALWIGGAGSGGLKVTMINGDVVSFAGVPVGMMLLAVKRVWTTGTSVTSVIGMKAMPYAGGTKWA